jgi:hypothetical protein
MIDIPIGKALVAVEIKCNPYCDECDISEIKTDANNCPMLCVNYLRKDGKDVFFKLVDYPEEKT